MTAGGLLAAIDVGREMVSMVDPGAWVMFAATSYAYLHICGTPLEGNEYHEGEGTLDDGPTLARDHHGLPSPPS